MLWIASANESLTGFTRDKDIKSSSAPHYFLSQSFAPSSAMFKIERSKLFICCGEINNYLDAPSYIRSWGWESMCGKRWKFKNRFVPMHISSWWPQQSCLICNDCGHTFEITVRSVGWLFVCRFDGLEFQPSKQKFRRGQSFTFPQSRSEAIDFAVESFFLRQISVCCFVLVFQPILPCTHTGY